LRAGNCAPLTQQRRLVLRAQVDLDAAAAAPLRAAAAARRQGRSQRAARRCLGFTHAAQAGGWQRRVRRVQAEEHQQRRGLQLGAVLVKGRKLLLGGERGHRWQAPSRLQQLSQPRRGAVQSRRGLMEQGGPKRQERKLGQAWRQRCQRGYCRARLVLPGQLRLISRRDSSRLLAILLRLLLRILLLLLPQAVRLRLVKVKHQALQVQPPCCKLRCARRRRPRLCTRQHGGGGEGEQGRDVRLRPQHCWHGQGTRRLRQRRRLDGCVGGEGASRRR
jgi:hypothetical protein